MFDEADRGIGFAPTKSPYDPRHMLHGHHDETGAWVGGFFDRGSWMETMDGWSKTVVVGHGRLGGVPIGAIAVETRGVEAVIPTDPANLDPAEQTAIRDLGHVGLPLLNFANWRGLLGGQSNMFDDILKFGSCIVTALHTYPGPVFVYIVPHGELRGGAWVVLDPSIHYVDTTARGGALELLSLLPRVDEKA
ncbi:acetyl-coenzyme-A carboxylase [Blastocladiella emersonii ATCC 22665]|nr:acetyl-coenzyme-A carboxylase [Blastocladiella emersonii ATCC 22665]